MARQKGTVKTGGRKKGVPNKTTAELREKLSAVLEGEFEKIEPTLRKIEKDNPQQYLSLVEKLISYVVPKKRDITSDDKSITPTITITEHRAKSKAD